MAGRIVCQGSVESVTSEYASRSELAYSMSFAPDPKSPSICRISVNAEALESRDLIVDVEFESPWPLQTAVGGLLLKTVMGEPVWGSNCRFHRYESSNQELGSRGASMRIARIADHPRTIRSFGLAWRSTRAI